MADRLRSIGCYLFVIILIGGLWVYADLRQLISHEIYVPPAKVFESVQPPPPAPAVAGADVDVLPAP